MNVTYGGNQAFTFSPDTYHVDSVFVNGRLVGGPPGSYQFNNVQGDSSIRITFAINSYRVDASSGSNGSISPSGTTWVRLRGQSDIYHDSGHWLCRLKCSCRRTFGRGRYVVHFPKHFCEPHIMANFGVAG